MTNKNYDRSSELMALNKRRKLTKQERDELAEIQLAMIEAEAAKLRTRQQRRQMPVVNEEGGVH